METPQEKQETCSGHFPQCVPEPGQVLFTERDGKMTPDKQKTIKGLKVQQYYWSGKDVVYVDNHLVSDTYDNITEETIDNVTYPSDSN